MSRIGKQPVAIPGGVTAAIDGQEVKVKGPKGELKHVLVDEVIAKTGENGIEIVMREDTKEARAMWGMSRTLVANLVTGVTDGFSKTLEITGVGYRAAMQGQAIQLQLGYSHDITYPLPDGIQAQCPKPTEIVISGIDKQQVGQVAAEIRRFRPPEPYKGKGVRYAGEYIFRKEGRQESLAFPPHCFDLRTERMTPAACLDVGSVDLRSAVVAIKDHAIPSFRTCWLSLRRPDNWRRVISNHRLTL
jgi:large subunit ribosomal protein L6